MGEVESFFFSEGVYWEVDIGRVSLKGCQEIYLELDESSGELNERLLCVIQPLNHQPVDFVVEFFKGEKVLSFRIFVYIFKGLKFLVGYPFFV